MADSKRSVAIAFGVAVAAGLVVEWTKDFSVSRWIRRALVSLVQWLRTRIAQKYGTSAFSPFSPPFFS